MSRTVLLVSTLSDGTHTVSVDEAPFIEKEPEVTVPPPEGAVSEPMTIKASPTEAVFAALWSGGTLEGDEVRSAGEVLYSRLATQSHVRNALSSITGRREEDGAFPIFFKLSRQTEVLPWEALYSDKRFLALDRWPIGRLVGLAARPTVLERTLDRRLRITLVLAAGGVGENAEWDAWSDAWKALGPLAPVVQVILSDKVLKGRIDGMVLANVSTEFLGDTPEHLAVRVTSFAPNILYFLCHGSSELEPQLKLTTLKERAVGKGDSFLTVERSDLKWAVQLQTLWLVVLNCCQSAKLTRGARSLGQDLVEAGVPALVAMREVVDVEDALVFASCFFQKLAKELGPWFSGGDPPKSFDGAEWARALCSPRAQIVRRISTPKGQSWAAANSTQWILPLLYVHRSPVTLKFQPVKPGLRPEESVKIRKRLSLLRGLQAELAGEPDNPVGKSLGPEIEQLESKLQVGGQ